MSFFTGLFRTTRVESVVFIDIGADSVAGAYARYSEGSTPALLYTERLPMSLRKGEPHERAMLRALEALGSALIREGAPILMRATGSGSADAILVSIDAPWQTTSVRTERFERKIPFVFTKSMLSAALEKSGAAAPGKLLADESIIGTMLNGYETREPYGKKVHRAAVVILTSLIDERVAEGIAALLRTLYHTKRISLIAGSSLRYQALRIAFPHERDALILDAAGSLTSIALVRKDLFVALTEVSDGATTNGDEWVQKIVGEFAMLAQQYPLPRTIFLLARESDISSLLTSLNAAHLAALWLSDNPPKVVSVLASHIVGLVRQVSAAPPDLQLLLMALFWQHHASEEKDLMHIGYF